MGDEGDEVAGLAREEPVPVAEELVPIGEDLDETNAAVKKHVLSVPSKIPVETMVEDNEGTKSEEEEEEEEDEVVPRAASSTPEETTSIA